MSGKYNDLKAAIRNQVQQINSPFFDEVRKAFDTEIASLSMEGIINLGEDYQLAGFALECRVKQIFEKMGFKIRPGRDNLEDFIIQVPDDADVKTPLVVEVKSSRKPQIARDQLRQLDDWVFDLSQEEKARKHGLGGGGGIDFVSVASHGMMSRGSLPSYHPSPHKGVMIFNGPVGTPFSARPEGCVGANEAEFVDTRNFCVVPFDVLIHYFNENHDSNQAVISLWNKMHFTAGVLSKEELY